MLSLAPKSGTQQPPARPSSPTVIARKCAGCEERLQTNLAISAPGDALEREADQVAEKVMRMAEPPSISLARPSLARRGDAAAPESAPPSVHEALRSPGTALDAETRGFFEPRFGRNLDAVRIHTDAASARSARDVRARAYTVGADIVFAAGRYQPQAQAGKQLLAHELAHVVQQHSGLARGLELEEPNPPKETLPPVPGPGPQQPAAPPPCPCKNPPDQNDRCKLANDTAVSTAYNTLAGRLPGAQQKVDDFIAEPDPARRSGTEVEKALTAHFGVTAGAANTIAVATKLKTVIASTTKNISNTACHHCPATCGNDKDATTIAASSPFVWHKTNCYSFCPTYFTFTPVKQATVLAHEMMHSWESMGDAAYENQGAPTYPPLTAIAQTNADSFACAIRDLG